MMPIQIFGETISCIEYGNQSRIFPQTRFLEVISQAAKKMSLFNSNVLPISGQGEL